MTVDRQRFIEQSKLARERLQDRILSAHLHLFHAAVPLEQLTQSGEWNHYLTLVEGLLTITRAQRDEFQRKLADPNVVNVDALMHLKLQLAAAQTRIVTLEEVRDLPTQIIGAAHRSTEQAHDRPA